MPPSRARGRGNPSSDPIAYVTAAAVIRDEADKWDAKPWNRFGQGPVHIHREADNPETWRKLAWSRMATWSTQLFRKEETPENILLQMRRVADTWETQASLHPPPDLSPDEVRRSKAIETGTPLTPAAPIAKAFARLEANLFSRVPKGFFVIGGGSVLQMRYDHRDSTDIDLFYPKTRISEMARLGRRGLWEAVLESEPGFHDAAGASGFTPDGTKASAFPADTLTDAPRAQLVAAHRIPAQATKHILHGKLLRCSDEPTDVTIAARLEPDAIAQALGRLRASKDGSDTIIENLEQVPDNLFEVDPDPIIKPRYDLELDGLAKRLIPLIETGDPGFAPQTSRRDQQHQALHVASPEYLR